MQPPQVQLSPGSTDTANVKLLQQYLVSQGYMTQAQMDTGAGTYGPATTAAVLKLQQAEGIDYSSGPGIYGPKTVAALGSLSPSTSVAGFLGLNGPLVPPSTGTTSVTTPSGVPTPAGPVTEVGTFPSASNVANPPTSTNTSGGSGTTGGAPPVITPAGTTGGGGTTGSTDTTGAGAGVAYNPAWAQWGITQDMWNQANAQERAWLGIIGSTATTQSSKPISSLTMQEALAQASSDPNVIQSFADAFGLDKAALQQQLQQLQITTSSTQQQQQTAFENERKALANAQAAAGTAYSGFRGKAQKDLAQTETGIVTSSRSQIQKQVQDLTSAFESKYGTAATTPASIAFLNPFAASGISISGQTTPGGSGTETLAGQLAGGIVGSQANAPGGAEYAAIDAAAAKAVAQGIYPATASGQ